MLDWLYRGPIRTQRALGTLTGHVTDAATGTTLWEKDSTTAMVPASSTKMLTTAAALLTLGPDDKVRTVVKSGRKTGQIVLIGGGDITLAPSREQAFYTNAPTIHDLANQVKKKLGGQRVTSVVVDNSRAGQGNTFNRSWNREDIAGGYVTSVDSVMLNGGRQDPHNAESPRTDNPALAAGQALAQAVGASFGGNDGNTSVQSSARHDDGWNDRGDARRDNRADHPQDDHRGNAPGRGDDRGEERDRHDNRPDERREEKTNDAGGVSVSTRPVATDGDELGAVESAPLMVRIRDMLINSDNMEAEAIGRDIAKKQGKPLTFDGATAATKDVLAQHDFPLDRVILKDNSGMSRDNRITPKLLDRIMVEASSPVGGTSTNGSSSVDEKNRNLRPLLDGLPIAGGSGTLAGRFTPGSPAERGAGWVRAKTGTLEGVSALVGTVMNQRGRILTFAFMSNGSDIEPARAALDNLASTLRTTS